MKLILINKLLNRILRNDKRLFIGQMILPISCRPSVRKFISAGAQKNNFMFFNLMWINTMIKTVIHKIKTFKIVFYDRNYL